MKKSIVVILTLIVSMVAFANSAASKEVKQMNDPGIKFQVHREKIWLPHEINLLSITPREAEDQFLYLWFFEHTMFDAMEKGYSVYQGQRPTTVTLNEDASRAEITAGDDFQWKLECQSVEDGVDLDLTVTNNTDYIWPEISSIMPCLTPGSPHADKPPRMCEAFRDEDRTHTYYLGPDGLALLPEVNIPLRFSHQYRPQVNQILRKGGHETDKLPTSRFPNSEGSKWAISPEVAHSGLMVRESSGGEWVVGVAWEDYLSVSAHYPLRCLHMAVRLGALEPGKTRTIRGKIYLFKGAKEDCLKRYRSDFDL